MIKISITKEIIPVLQSDEIQTNNGSELQFSGRVRKIEKGQVISAIDYEYYQGMAEKELWRLGEKTISKFSISNLNCVHRVGKIPVGEASLKIVIWSKHRRAGLDAMEWFISQMKQDVPIWKNAILKDGSRISSKCQC
jgi:molybdopterin synthase catalytic subunit